jgi:hypothetical protein
MCGGLGSPVVTHRLVVVCALSSPGPGLRSRSALRRGAPGTTSSAERSQRHQTRRTRRPSEHPATAFSRHTNDSRRHSPPLVSRHSGPSRPIQHSASPPLAQNARRRRRNGCPGGAVLFSPLVEHGPDQGCYVEDMSSTWDFGVVCGLERGPKVDRSARLGRGCSGARWPNGCRPGRVGWALSSRRSFGGRRRASRRSGAASGSLFAELAFEPAS